jgi:hypothetical protein
MLNHFVVFVLFHSNSPRFTWGYSCSSTSWIISMNILNEARIILTIFLFKIKEKQ